MLRGVSPWVHAALVSTGLGAGRGPKSIASRVQTLARRRSSSYSDGPKSSVPVDKNGETLAQKQVNALSYDLESDALSE